MRVDRPLLITDTNYIPTREGQPTMYMLDYGSRVNRVLYESNPNGTK